MTPPEVANAVPISPLPPYALWWAATESCSGLRGDFAAVRWASAPDAVALADDGHTGSWYAPTNQITLAGRHLLDGALVRHEMLHALLGARYHGQHPSEYFGSRCEGVVQCSDTPACGTAVRAAQPLVVAGAPVLTPADLRAQIAVTPASFPVDSNGGWMLVTVSVHNPRAEAIVVRLDPPGTQDAPAFGCMLVGEERLLMAGAGSVVFGPGQVRRQTFDIPTHGSRPGTYVARAYFNTAPADTALVTLRP